MNRVGRAIDVTLPQGRTHLEVLEDVHDRVRKENAVEGRGKLHAVEGLVRSDVVLSQP